jgi:hypothetical protein
MSANTSGSPAERPGEDGRAAGPRLPPPLAERAEQRTAQEATLEIRAIRRQLSAEVVEEAVSPEKDEGDMKP